MRGWNRGSGTPGEGVEQGGQGRLVRGWNRGSGTPGEGWNAW